MKLYKILVEGQFVSVGSESGRANHGFFSTFYVSASNVNSAVDEISGLLRKRMDDNGIKASANVFFPSFFIIKDIWEVESSILNKSKANALGFSLFQINLALSLALIAKKILIKIFKKRFVIGIQ